MNEPLSQTSAGNQTDIAAQAYITERVKAGASKKAIVQELIQRGYDPLTANKMVGGISGKHAASARTTGLLLIIGGLAITAISIAITVSSYSTASQQGGTYYICYGAMIFGIILAIRGIVQLIRGREIK